MLLHPLTNFEIQRHYKNVAKFNGVYSRNNVFEYESIETRWMALYVNANNTIHFDSFAVEHIPKEIKKFIENKNIMTNIYRIQA